MPPCPASVLDLLSLPEDARVELLDGKLIELPARSLLNQRIAHLLSDLIGGPYDDQDGHGGPGGWWIFTEPLVSFPPQVYRPSIAGWRRQRLPNPDLDNPIPVIPDWLCEIHPLRGAAHARVRKRADYGIHGVKHYWLVDQTAGVIEALELDGRVWRECGAWGVESREVPIPPFETIPVDLSLLFSPR